MKNVSRADLGRAKYSILRQRLFASAAAALLVGCTSSNITEFSDGLDTQVKSTSSVDKSDYAVGLLPSGVIDARSSRTITTASVSSSTLGGPAKSLSDGLSYSVPKAEKSQTEQRISELYNSFDHGKCKSGWGKQAKALDALRYNAGDPYYIEIRMRHTPPLPVGHTYTAYGRLDKGGNKLDEHLVMLAPKGGYAGATMAAAVPMASKMEPTRSDCLITPKAAYRVSLSATQYEKLLAEIKKAKAEKPRYSLWNQNCNHMTSRLSESVGIKAPSNRYTASLVYMYDIMRENEGKNYKPTKGFRQEVASNKLLNKRNNY